MAGFDPGLLVLYIYGEIFNPGMEPYPSRVMLAHAGSYGF